MRIRTGGSGSGVGQSTMLSVHSSSSRDGDESTLARVRMDAWCDASPEPSCPFPHRRGCGSDRSGGTGSVLRGRSVCAPPAGRGDSSALTLMGSRQSHDCPFWHPGTLARHEDALTGQWRDLDRLNPVIPEESFQDVDIMTDGASERAHENQSARPAWTISAHDNCLHIDGDSTDPN